ncbi:DinB family protein [Pseudovibrio brasiliensis]|uniref:DinB family protein n=1 Tax=Pseudovibrio brasiliensis TaxID=1898042 RepID=A0ABX8AKL2_9HYPH|nr:DinB family protein [Pseudovibrio brasiliensis]QUS55335.1 DinB family protein [Pseudovibrio brasiliensis]
MYSDFKLLAQYNTWMNTRLYTCAEQLSDEQLKEDRGAFFQSIFATFNHIVVGDLTWLRRFAQHSPSYKSLQKLESFPVPTALTSIPFEGWEELKAARQSLDKIIEEFAGDVTPSEADKALSYANMKGIPATKNFGDLVLHFFNHQTHHRGQITTLLTQFGLETPDTDLLFLCQDA